MKELIFLLVVVFLANMAGHYLIEIGLNKYLSWTIACCIIIVSDWVNDRRLK